jgi:hypothetical protein
VLGFLELWPRYLKEGLDNPNRLRIADWNPQKKPLNTKKVRSDDSPFARMKTELWESIDYLVLLKNAVYSGPMKGIKMLEGDNGARGYKVVSSASVVLHSVWNLTGDWRE